MHVHANARLTPVHGCCWRGGCAKHGWSVKAAADAAGISVRTAYKWLARYRAEGIDGLRDRSSRPHRSPARLSADRVAAILALRRLWFTAAQIAELLQMALSTVSLVLKRNGLGRRSALIPKEQQRRYECARPGDLVHIDIKKLPGSTASGTASTAIARSRSVVAAAAWPLQFGYEFVHVAVDDAPRLAYAEVLRTSAPAPPSVSCCARSGSFAAWASTSSAS